MDDPTIATRLAPFTPIDRSSYEPAYVQLVNVLSHAIATGPVPRRRPAPHRGRALRRVRREPDDGAPRHRRAARPRRREHHARARHVRQAARAQRRDVRAQRVPRPARRPARRRQGARDPRAARRGRAPPPTWRWPKARAIISIKRLLQRGDEPLFYHRNYLRPRHAHGRSGAGCDRPARPVRGRVGAGP